MKASVFLILAALFSLGAANAHAAMSCPRGVAGGVVAAPPDLYSQDGLLQTILDYQTRTDSDGRILYCFTTPDGLESPTLHVQPGDHVVIKLRNRLPQSQAAASSMAMPVAAACGDTEMNGGSVNIHFHGMNVAPVCHSDEVLRTVVNPGQAFTYSFYIPKNEPPGLYWYHPHIHGISAKAVFGGASGAIEVQGIPSVQPAVAGLTQRYLVIRDQAVPGIVLHNEPNADLTINYVPVPFPKYPPASIQIQPGEKEFWRVLNASADTILDLQLRYDGHPQKLGIVALDGVPTYSQDGHTQGGIVTATHILIPAAGRAEFIVTMPAATVGTAELVTHAIDTGPAGDADPARRLALLTPAPSGSALPAERPASALPAAPDRFAGLDTAAVTAQRKLYFSEASVGPGDGGTKFYVTVDGATPTLYNPANPPAITTTQGAVEDWVIENRSTENHEFHIHQVHFKLLKRDGQPVPVSERQMLDTVQVPYWSGSGPYPSVTLRLDFRGPVVGDFVYHCHILDHEDGGMMAIIRVLPKAG